METTKQYDRDIAMEKAKVIVDRDILSCQTMLINDLMAENRDGFTYEDIENFYSYRVELLSRDKELEEADPSNFEDLRDEIQEELDGLEAEKEVIENQLKNAQKDQDKYDTLNRQLEELEQKIDNRETDIGSLENPESDTQEIYEWWLVNSWLADKLDGMGHPILRNDYDTWWGRCATGQAIALDPDIQEIAKDIVLPGRN